MNLIADYLDKRKFRKHDLLKAKINTLQIERSYAEVNKHPQAEIDRLARKIKRLSKKLNRGRV